MSKLSPANNAMFSSPLRKIVALLCLLPLTLPAVLQAQQEPSRRLQAIDVEELPGQRLELRLRMSEAAPEPMTFTISNPARIALDLPGTGLALPSRRQDVNRGPLTTILAAEADGRTRVVLNMTAMSPYTTRVDGDSVYVIIGDTGSVLAAQTTEAEAPVRGTAAARPAVRSIDNIDFRRGPDGAGRVIVELSDPRTNVDVRREGGRLLVEFRDTGLPDELLRRLDVTDFATPVTSIDALRAGRDARLIVTPSGDYEQVAYHVDNVFTLELKTPAERQQLAPGVFDSDREYTGTPMSINIADIETRAVLQILAEYSGLNVVVSDTVRGNLTLRLQNVPWDQALDIVLTTRGLDMRRNGNVVIVAPAEEIAAREQAQLQALSAMEELEPLYSEFIQVNYAKAADIAQLISADETGSLISERGSVSIDARTNTLLVHDTSDRLLAIRQLVRTLDIPVQQVSVESRIVIVNEDFSRDLGVRFGTTAVRDRTNGLISLTGNGSGSETIVQSALSNLQTSGTPFPVSTPAISNRYNVNLPIGSPAGSLAMAILDADYLVDLELTALQAEGRGRIISTPRVITANQHEASIEQGVEIPYQESASSGATTTSFKDAVLKLLVTPQITPDDRIIMDLTIQKDSVGEVVPSATGGFVPSIDTRSVMTQVLVRDGETVVLGGIYETETRNTISKVPVLGDIPGLGFLFRTRLTSDDSAELLIFVTPRIVTLN